MSLCLLFGSASGSVKAPPPRTLLAPLRRGPPALSGQPPRVVARRDSQARAEKETESLKTRCVRRRGDTPGRRRQREVVSVDFNGPTLCVSRLPVSVCVSGIKPAALLQVLMKVVVLYLSLCHRLCVCVMVSSDILPHTPWM